MLDLLQSIIFNQKNSLLSIVLFMKRICQVAVLSSDDIQFLLVNFIIFCVQQDARLRFLIRQRQEDEYVYFENLLGSDYDAMLGVLEDIEKSGMLNCVALQEMAVLLRSSNKNV